MLTKNLDITYAMVWSVALANILGAGLCYAFSPQFAKLATLRYTLILPAVLGIVYIGAFEATRNWGDLFALLFFGLVGWLMKQFKWPRPPLILGVVLGDIDRALLFISIERYGVAGLPVRWWRSCSPWRSSAWCGRSCRTSAARAASRKMLTSFQAPTFHPAQLFTMFILAVIGTMVIMALQWDFSAKIVPLVVGTIALHGGRLEPVQRHVPQAGGARSTASLGEQAQHEVEQKIHMDLTSDTGHLPVTHDRRRARRGSSAT